MSASLTAEILKLEDERRLAVVKSDGPALQRLLHPNYRHIYAGGTLDGKESFIEKRVRPDYIKYKAIEIFDTEVLIFGDTAIVRGNADIVETFPDERGDVPARLRFTDVWVRENGAWQSINWQNCKRTGKKAQ